MTGWAPTELQSAVLEKASEIGLRRSIARVCREAKVSRQSFYTWLKEDPGFKAAWESLWREAISRHLPGVIAAQVSKAQSGETPAARLLVEMAGLIKQQIEHTGKDGGPILIEQATREKAQQELNEWRQHQIEQLSTQSAPLIPPISPTSTA